MTEPLRFKRPRGWAATRRRIYRRDHGICGICEHVIRDEERWHVDHVVPRSRGGGHEDSNLRLAHERCNSARHADMDGVVVRRVQSHMPFSRLSRFS